MAEATWSKQHRLFITPDALSGPTVTFDRAQSHQLARVLRVQATELVIVLTGDGLERLVRLTEIDAKRSVGEVIAERTSQGDPRLQVTLYQAMLPRERFELALAKCTEIGIRRFVPLRTQRIVGRLDARDWSAREQRLRSIAREAAEQSERATIPEIVPPMSLEAALRAASNEGPVLLAWERGEDESAQPDLRTLARASQRVSIFIGPEGGFSPEEVELARAAGAKPVWLGPRILRAETAGAVLATILLWEAGDLTG